MKTFYKPFSLAAVVSAALISTSSMSAENVTLPNLSYSGYIRADGDITSTKPSTGDSTSSSDIKASKIQLTLDAEMSEQISSSITFEWKGKSSNTVEVDEAIIKIAPKDMGLQFSLGKQATPFGTYNSSFITDPQSKVLGETKKHSVNVYYAMENIKISGSVYNGDVNETGDDEDHIDGYVARIDFNVNSDLSISSSIISNIAESDTLESSDGVNSETNTIQDFVAGFSANASYKFNNLQFDAEYITALDEFKAGELAFDNGNEYKPQTLSFEAKYDLGDDSLVAGRIETGKDGGDVIAEKTFGLFYERPLLQYLTFGAEYQRSEFETNEKIDSLIMRLQLNF